MKAGKFKMQYEQTDIGLQLYDDSGDSKDKLASIECFDKIMSRISLTSAESILDVGCGNGRLNVVHNKYFSKIVGIDAFRLPDPKYSLPNFEFKSLDIFGVEGIFNAILFMGTFYLHHPYGYFETIERSKNILSTNGKIIIIDEKNRNVNFETHIFGKYNLAEICSGLDLKISQSFIQDEGYHSVNVIENKEK
jgi:cyclopropane fatty-acyl-phospholipid synthase-like methyltransferase